MLNKNDFLNAFKDHKPHSMATMAFHKLSEIESTPNQLYFGNITTFSPNNVGGFIQFGIDVNNTLKIEIPSTGFVHIPEFLFQWCMEVTAGGTFTNVDGYFNGYLIGYDD